jgi:hypothetical protein
VYIYIYTLIVLQISAPSEVFPPTAVFLHNNEQIY